MHDSDEHGSVTAWLKTITVSPGEADTAWRNLWERYAPAMRALARRHLAGGRKPLADEEDIVVEAFRDLFQGIQAGRFTQLTNRDDLQQILITITQRRAIDAVRKNAFRTAHEAGESALSYLNRGASSLRPLDCLPGPENPPELPLLACEELTRLLDALRDEQLRQVAVMRVLSATDQEIARELNVSVRTVGRKLELIARRWRQIAERDSHSPQA